MTSKHFVFACVIGFAAIGCASSDGGDGSGSSTGSDTSSGSGSGDSGCSAMCSHLYSDCGFALEDGSGGFVSETTCVATCTTSFSADQIGCLSTAACTTTDLNTCISGATPDNGGYMDACMCTSDPGADPLYGTFCSGTDDGCQGVGLSGELGCLAKRSTGAGTCTYPCSSADIGYQGACPTGYLCEPGPYLDASDQNWPVCLPN